ncbi:Transmembrane protein 69 [Chionoecetes opilio]|uniref:Transmembrane protein 69 n=1 Tax=Chionoecetes opilio TaxID=41210 RepID=A0A8J4Y9R6_CHIOP|nr:Transmembrane protein 69 [Chionoecetes opilio]
MLRQFVCLSARVRVPWHASCCVGASASHPYGSSAGRGGAHQGCCALWPRRLHTSPTPGFREDKTTTSLALLDAVKQVRHSPTPALALGISGLVPFVAVPAYMITAGIYEAELAQAQLFYGASILSFLGGVRWGLTLPEGSTQPPDWHNLGYSVAPSLVAWLGLLAPHTVGVLTVIGAWGSGVHGYGYVGLSRLVQRHEVLSYFCCCVVSVDDSGVQDDFEHY